MAKKIHSRVSAVHRRNHFILEMSRLKKYFPFLNCTLRGNQLTCRGTITPSDGCDTYKIKLVYIRGRTPKVYVIDPPIEPHPKYHIYDGGHLCLYDPRESPWSPDMMVHETIIPWTAEWLVFYEIWKETGDWLGPEAPHEDGEKSGD